MRFDPESVKIIEYTDLAVVSSKDKNGEPFVSVVYEEGGKQFALLLDIRTAEKISQRLKDAISISTGEKRDTIGFEVDPESILNGGFYGSSNG